MKPTIPSFLVLATLLLGFLTPCAWAYPWMPPTPQELVQHSDFIVVGHIKGDLSPSISRGQYSRGYQGDHSAVLVIKEVVKGEVAVGKTRIIIHAGLKPVVTESGGLELAFGNTPDFYSDDIRQDQLWFLQKEVSKAPIARGSMGVWVPNVPKARELKDYYAPLLSDHPEDIFRKHLDGPPILARACHAYLDPGDIHEITKIANLDERIEKLLPYLLSKEPYNPGRSDNSIPCWDIQSSQIDIHNLRSNHAKDQLVHCGKGVADKLVPIFVDPKYELMRCEIMNMWAALEYKDATPLIVATLQKENEYWSKHRIASHRWLPNRADKGWDEGLSRNRISDAVNALGVFHDPRGKEILLLTKKQWEPIEASRPENSIPFLCDYALKEIEDNSE